MQQQKQCYRCQAIKGVDSYSIDRKSKYGLKNWRRACVSDYNRENKSRINERSRAYREQNKEKLRQYFKDYSEKNKVAIAARNRAAYAKNSEKYKQNARDREKLKREQIRLKQKSWRERNPDKFKSIQRKSKAKNRETVKANYNRYRARKLNAVGKYTKEDILRIHRQQNGKCACCRLHLEPNYHADHIIPLSKGGSNEARNIQLLCPSCNGKKGAKDPIIFMQQQGFLL